EPEAEQEDRDRRGEREREERARRVRHDPVEPPAAALVAEAVPGHQLGPAGLGVGRLDPDRVRAGLLDAVGHLAIIRQPVTCVPASAPTLVGALVSIGIVVVVAGAVAFALVVTRRNRREEAIAPPPPLVWIPTARRSSSHDAYAALAPGALED